MTNSDESDESEIRDVMKVTKNDELTNIFDTHASKECSVEDLIKRFSQAQIKKFRTEGVIIEVRPGWYRLP